MKIVILDGYTANPGDYSWKELSGFGEVETALRLTKLLSALKTHI